ncbi:Uncharacterised protein [Actinobacillus lignieresii]|uniref:hypothetical protein n=1 Tax=Actinobacillus TaxID=713 RepID=UPI000F6F78C6|nr:hypothetical protein [Actinobacillus lignieresii]VEB25754.1 Uncharacterised protein [Actinobacillus lignieresii]
MFNEQFFFNLLMGVAAFLASWFIKSIFSKDDELKNEIKDVRNAIDKLREDVKNEYQTKELAKQVHEGFTETLDRIYKTVETINQKLDKKADR